MPTVWPYWVDQGTGGAFTAVGTSAQAWNGWVNLNYQIASANTQTTVWPQWVNQPITVTQPQQWTVWMNWQSQLAPLYAPQSPPPPLTPEQITERAARFERTRREQARNAIIYRNRERSKMLRRRPAERRAEALLLEQLNEEQRKEWTAERAFTVHTADGKRAYRIAYGLAGNVRLVKAEERPQSKWGYPLGVGARFCMHVYHPEGWVPNEDNVLAQKLLIESNEQHFLDLANVS